MTDILFGIFLLLTIIISALTPSASIPLSIIFGAGLIATAIEYKEK